MPGTSDPYGQPPPPGGYYGPPPTERVDPRAYAPQPYYVPYGYPGGPGYPPPPPMSRGPVRPALVLAAAILGWINAGVIVVAGALLLFGSAIVRSFDDSFGSSATADATELLLLGLGNLVASGLLIGGGVVFAGGQRTGRRVFAAGNGVVLALLVYWLARSADGRFNGGDNGWLVWGVIFGLVALLSLAFAFTTATGRWLGERAVSRSTAAPPTAGA